MADVLSPSALPLRSPAPVTPRIDAGAVTALLLVGGCLNGLAFRIIAAWKTDGAEAALGLFDVSPIEILVMVIAGRLMLAGGDRLSPATTRGAALLFALPVLWPSSSAAWICVGLYAAFIAASSSAAARFAALLFAGLAAHALWSSLGEPIAGNIILPLDAAAVGGVLSLVRSGVAQLGNVVGDMDGHRIVVLVGCSSVHALPLALLGWAALSLEGRASLPAGAWREAALLAAFLVVFNLGRLAIMAWSAEAYTLAHGLWGGLAFDTVSTLAILAAAAATRCRHA